MAQRLPFVEQGWIDVVNYVENEQAGLSEKQSVRQPIVLARLPRVGGSSTRPASPAPAQHAIAPPERLPQLDLRTEIQQRTELHIASTREDEASSSTSHFVDRQHAPNRERSRSTHRSDPSPSPLAAPTPTTMGEKMFRLHARLAPHAGMIVALALIASAGLLYWMIVGPTNSPLPNYQTPSYEMQPDGLGTTSGQMPDDYLPEFATESRPGVEPANSQEQWTKMTLSAPQQIAVPETTVPAETRSAELPLTENSTPALQELPLVDEFQFLETSHPQELDFSALHRDSSTATAKPVPKVAERPTTSSSR